MARRGAGRCNDPRGPRPGARRPRHHHRRRDAARELLKPLRDRARRRRHRQSRHRARPLGASQSRAARRRQDQAQASCRSARSRIPDEEHRPHGEDDGARPLHHVAAGAKRLLRERGGLRARLCRGRERGDQGPLRRRRRHRADRRTLYAGAAGEGAPIRPEGTAARPRRRERHEGAPHLLRLCRDHPRAPGGLFVPAGACRHTARPDLDRDRTIEARHVGARQAPGEDDYPRRHRPLRPERRDAGDRGGAHSPRTAACAGGEDRGGAGLRHEIPAA